MDDTDASAEGPGRSSNDRPRRQFSDPRSGKFYKEKYPIVFTAACLVVNSVQTAEDVAQNVFIEVLTSADVTALLDKPADEQDRLLQAIAARRGIDHMRRQSRLVRIIQQRVRWTESGAVTHVEEEVLTREVVRAIANIKNELHRAIAVMAWISDMTSPQIAAEVGLSPERVRGIRLKLKERFRSEFVEVETEVARPQEGTI
ncbi:sigma-70 family RNA polymerase sigma factor [Dactylosporangium aurantiacum]|uniref:Sigma-70 family RNA polymerase sigma factor n=1 Tax=Dactylosporangium aurantiacum TaxID=35754 RepID=A0A9Q9IKZ5_9ACTN|nr:sigma-70 family RNA polymerase sigma factor [Dactylosporangium aurantiacum]MDG6108832.1 sigma-70 family RNA polymerase sigma factor [Dactylosporangium aurantiacum]UWZ55762.1 sigma-70 family RNA polymerase sigma factor [Dactylosporangium aurantiacum]